MLSSAAEKDVLCSEIEIWIEWQFVFRPRLNGFTYVILSFIASFI